MGDFMAIAAKLCGKPVAVIKRLGKEDLERVLAHSGEVVAPGQATGDKV